MASEPVKSRRGHARATKRSQRTQRPTSAPAFITRQVPVYELAGEELLALVEHNAERVLQEIGIDFKGHPDAIDRFRNAGADINGERVLFPPGLCRQLVQATAPRQFTQYARNPARNIEIGGNHMVLAPAYGSPFVHDLDHGRRYATLNDFEQFTKLAYLSPYLHHSGGTLCEPVDRPVNQRHLDMIYSHLRWSDKPFMGSVTAPERAQDTVDMAKLVFGDDFVEQHCVITSLINANSPMTFDSTMLGAARVYAAHGQATVISPFILAGAMSPVTVLGTCAQLFAEALAGMAYVQLVRPGAPVIFGTFSSSISMQSGAPTFGTPEPALVMYIAAALARRLGVPFRSGGGLCASKIPDAQAAFESANTLQTSMLAGVNFMLHAAGWLEGGLTMGYEKFVLDADQAGMIAAFAAGVDSSINGQALDALRDVGPGNHFLGCDHTQANFEKAFYRSSLADNNSFEQWRSDGSLDAAQRANKQWKSMLADYVEPPIDAAVDEALKSFVIERRESLPPTDF